MKNTTANNFSYDDERFKRTQEKLYSFLELKESAKLVQAARDLFVKSFNPIYFYLILEYSKRIEHNIDLSYLLRGRIPSGLPHYLMASEAIYDNNLDRACVNFSFVLEQTRINEKLPLFTLEYVRDRLLFEPKIINIHRASKENTQIIDNLIEKKRNPKPRIKEISVNTLKDYEEYYKKIQISSGIPIDKFKSITTCRLPNGLAYNKFWLKPENENEDKIPVEFPRKAITQKGLLLLLMVVREESAKSNSKLDHDIFSSPEKYKQYYEDTLLMCGKSIKGDLNFKNSTDWWADNNKRRESRKTIVSRINKRFKDIKDHVVVENAGAEFTSAYMLVETLEAEITEK